MKKLCCLLLAAFLLTACAAPAGTSGETGGNPTDQVPAESFRVGFGMTDITPRDSVPLGGYSRSDLRMSQGFISRLYGTCIAVTDGQDNTVLLFSLDLHDAQNLDGIIKAVSLATDVPEGSIFLSVTHTHSAPDLSNSKNRAIQDYLQLLNKQLAAAAEAALEDLRPATMSGGSIAAEGMNFVRHYIMNDGTIAGDNFGDISSGYVGHVHVADPTLQLLKFTREGGEDIYLTNFQTHPHQTGGATKYDVSADVVGEYRAAMEKATGARVVYFSGAGGNLNSHSRIQTEQATKNYKEWGKKLADYACKIELKPLSAGPVQVSTEIVVGKVDHSMDEYAAVCQDLYNRWNSGQIDAEELKRLGLEAGVKLNSGQHARSIYTRSTLGETSEFEIYTVAFGDVAVVIAPFEMFDETGVDIRNRSPFGMTLIATLCNFRMGYLPTADTYEYGSYEVNSTRFAPGIAEQVADQYVSMLQAQYQKK